MQCKCGQHTCEDDAVAVSGTSCALRPIVALGSLVMNEGATAAGACVPSAVVVVELVT